MKYKTHEEALSQLALVTRYCCACDLICWHYALVSAFDMIVCYAFLLHTVRSMCL